MNIRRIFKKPDGSVLIAQFIEKTRTTFENTGVLETDLQLRDRQTAKMTQLVDGIMQKDLPYIDVNMADIPIDRTDREQWRQKNDGSKEIVWVDPTAPNPIKMAQDLTKQYMDEAKQGVIDATTLADLQKHTKVLNGISLFGFIQSNAEIV